MHWLDTVILCALGLGAVFGFVSGLFWQLARVAALGLAVFASVMLHDAATGLLRDHVLRDAHPGVVDGVAYGVVFVAVYVVLYVAARAARAWLRATDLAVADRLLGAILGAAKMAVVLGVGCLLLRNSGHPVARQWLEQSSLTSTFAEATRQTVALIPDHLKQPVIDGLAQWRESVLQTLSPAARDELLP